MPNKKMKLQPSAANEAGFSLIELMVAAVIFTIITGTAFSLFAQHQPIFKQQQNQAALNIAMRNAVAQMQLDIVNGGAGIYTGVNIPNWPVGVVINNNVVGSTQDCHTGTTYGANCFDSFTVIAADPTTPPQNPSTSTGTCSSTNSSSTIFLGPRTPAGYTSGALATAAAANYKSGDYLLFVSSDGSKYTVVKLSADASTGSVNGNANFVALTSHSTTDAAGLNTSTVDGTGATTNANSMLGASFCSTDWVVRLKPVEYDVDLTDATNPTLRRTELGLNHTLATDGVKLVNQVIGFKVGAALINGVTDNQDYNFDASSYLAPSSGPNPNAYNYTVVRSVMVSLVGRTAPNSPDLDPTFKFQNSFDGGHYQIQGVSVVVNPRNMSMAD
jgi:prepilin-type N-terminal cleavage/methylation domain-containing protein